MKKYIKSYMILVLGCLVMGIGIGMNNHAMLGNDPMSTLSYGIFQKTIFTFGVANFFVSLAQIVIGTMLEKSHTTIATFVSMFAASVGIDAFNLLHVPAVSGVWSYVCLVCGMVIYALGIALTQYPHCGYTSYDVLIFGIMKKTNSTYAKVRWFTDIAHIALGFLLGSYPGVCTVVLFLFSGKIIEFMYKMIVKVCGEYKG